MAIHKVKLSNNATVLQLQIHQRALEYDENYWFLGSDTDNLRLINTINTTETIKCSSRQYNNKNIKPVCRFGNLTIFLKHFNL